MQNLSDKALAQLSQDIRKWGQDLGFDAVGISPGELSGAGAELQNWLQRGWHGEMNFMSTHVAERTHPDTLFPILVESSALGWVTGMIPTGVLRRPFGIQKKRTSPGMPWEGTIIARCAGGCRS